MPCKDYYDDNVKIITINRGDEELKNKVSFLEEELCNLRGFICALVSEANIEIKDKNIKEDFDLILKKILDSQVDHRKKDKCIKLFLLREEANKIIFQINSLTNDGNMVPPMLLQQLNNKIEEINLIEKQNSTEELLSKKYF